MALAGKVAIVTGSSRGIGKAAALGLGREGVAVVVAARTERDSKELPGTIYRTADEIESQGGRALPVRVDITDEASVDQMVKKAVEAFGKVDILVNNAAVAYYSKLVETPWQRWDLVTRVNLRGTFLSTHAVLLPMIEQRRGSIINISSKAADIRGPIQTGIAYCATKAAVERFTSALAEEVREYNIAVNCVKPRWAVDTEGMRFWNPSANHSTWDKPEDFMVKAIIFLSRQDASSITGGIFTDEDICLEHNLF